MNYRKYVHAATVGVLSVGLVACSDSNTSMVDPLGQTQPANLGPDNIVNTAVAAGGFTTLAAALAATGLDTVLADGDRNFTVFAPTDDAFAALGQDTINNLLNDTETLSDILLYHVLADTVVDSATAISLAGQTVDAANGDASSINVDAGELFINLSKVTTGDVGASNGIIHVIDTVLMPPIDFANAGANLPNIVETAVAAGSFNTLVAALSATGLDATLQGEGPYTVFAPTDAAFAVLGNDAIDSLLNDSDTLSDILLYHVISGQAVGSTTAISLVGQSVETANTDPIALSLSDGKLLVNNATVIATDIVTSNGIIHVIDAVLSPPSDSVMSNDDVESNGDSDQNTNLFISDPSLPNIVETAVAAGSFNTLAAALTATGLDTTLQGEGPFTVFAPTDAAFSVLGNDVIDSLLNDPDTLSDILLYHVISGSAVDSTLAISLAGQSVETANMDSIALSLSGGNLLVNNATVITADILTRNGIIHVIDAVLSPPSDEVVSGIGSEQTQSTVYEAAKAAGLNTFAAAVEIAGLKDALNHPDDDYTVFAPTDAAFVALGSELFDSLVSDSEALRSILLDHVLPGTILSASRAAELVGVDIATGTGAILQLQQRSDGLYIGGVQISKTDIPAVNGVIHVIDSVLVLQQ